MIPMGIYTSRYGPAYMRDSNRVIIVPATALTVLNTKLNVSVKVAKDVDDFG